MASTNSTRIVTACDSGEQFVRNFYDRFDHSRHTIKNMFHGQAKLQWEGNEVVGADQIHLYYSNLPSTETQLEVIDAQPLSALVSGEELVILASASGRIFFGGRLWKRFSEVFVLKVDGSIWKVLNNTFRFSE